MTRRALVFVAALLASANTSLAQQKEPIGRVVADLRAASIGLPTAVGWTPVVTTGTIVPSRGLGIDAGVHIYPVRFRRVSLGIGAAWVTARATSAPPAPTTTTGSTASPTTTFPEVTTKISGMVPQLSLNFGHSMGWSYVSAGLGRSRVESEAAATSTLSAFVPRDSGWVKTLNYGGGARWFITDHIGVGFDLRWHKLSIVPASNTHPGAPRASLLVAGGGIVFK
jgi:hypothetical protein